MAGGDEIDVNLPSEEYFPTAITEDIIAAPELAAREGRTRQPPIRLADYVSGEESTIFKIKDLMRYTNTMKIMPRRNSRFQIEKDP
ncbi:hypothetical protein GH714_019788 [Hevea brasiliensis]|uniref:Uncharacterized protein n=1 Tax=Hevea brasiliensis TaxID=3981 RepID=A0A6A6N4S5_HEVBR|nr:hypothetical protein GH714_019788 [Hevea brasiliensis]